MGEHERDYRKVDGMIEPHGGKLVNRMCRAERIEQKLEMDAREASDLELLGCGAYSPLDGFMCKNDYELVLREMRLENGIVWPMPITIASDEKMNGDVALTFEGRVVGAMEVEESFSWDREKESESVYGTTDVSHPGVAYTLGRKKYLLGGKVKVFSIRQWAYPYIPEQTRGVIGKKGWKRVAAFQTRNAVHRAHEYVQKCALEICDGLMVQPLVGEKKEGDVPSDVMLKSYEMVVDRYYNRDRVLLAVLPAAMRYAGPKEAIFHAIVRKNYGATHFIVGRDHAGVGKFYGPYDAQRIFDDFSREELGIVPLCFENAFYCRACGSMATEKTCGHSKEERIELSGTMIRKNLSEGRDVPEDVLRREVVELLKEYYSRLQN